MPLMTWTNRMSVDVKLLDNDHKKLVAMINELHDGIMNGCARQALESVFEKLVKYTGVHFAHEERLLTEAGYPDAAAHKREHDHMIAQFRGLQAQFNRGEHLAIYLEVMNLLKSWLFDHIQISDQKYVPHFKTRGIDAILAAWPNVEAAVKEVPAAVSTAGQQSGAA